MYETHTSHPDSAIAEWTRPPTAPSWDVVVRTHSPRVYAYAYWLTGNRTDAEDLAQDVFVRAFRALPGGAPRNLGGWLRRITRNLYLDRVRHQRRIQFVELTQRQVWELVDSQPQPAEAVDRRSFDTDVRQALDSLPADTRAAVVLCDIGGLSYDEIATSLGVGRGAVRSRIHRGRRHLRSALSHRAPRALPVGSQP